MIGVGVFLGPRSIAQYLTSPGLVLGAWILGGLFVFCGALTYAELGAMMPESGGGYAYIRQAFGPFWAYLNGWSGFAVGKAASVSALAVGFGEILGLPRVAEVIVALVLIGAIALVNILGVRHAGRLGVWTMALKLGALVLLIVGGVLLADRLGATASTPLVPASVTSSGALISAFGLALVPIFFAYDGWVNSTQVAEEVRAPERNVPRSLILGTLIVMGAYVLVNLVYILALGGNVGATNSAASDSAQLIGNRAAIGLGDVFRLFIVFAILASIIGTINAVTLSGPRIGYAMARDGLFFRRVDSLTRWGTPGWSIVFQALISVALVLVPPIGGKSLFDTLITFIIVDSFFFYALGAACVFVFRRRMPHAPRPYRVPFYPILPLVFVVGTALFLVNTFVSDFWNAMGGVLIVLIGIPGYLYWSARNGPRRLRSVTYDVRANARDDDERARATDERNP